MLHFHMLTNNYRKVCLSRKVCALILNLLYQFFWTEYMVLSSCYVFRINNKYGRPTDYISSRRTQVTHVCCDAFARYSCLDIQRSFHFIDVIWLNILLACFITATLQVTNRKTHFKISSKNIAQTFSVTQLTLIVTENVISVVVNLKNENEPFTLFETTYI